MSQFSPRFHALSTQPLEAMPGQSPLSRAANLGADLRETIPVNSGWGRSSGVEALTSGSNDFSGRGAVQTAVLNSGLNASSLAVNSPSGVEFTMGDLSGTRVFRGAIDNSNTADVFAFSLSATSNTFNLTLSGLSNDADVRLIRDDNNNGHIDVGEIFITSALAQNQAEMIQQGLTAGNYLVEVFQFNGDTNYHLSVSTGDWYSTNLSDAGIIGETRFYAADGALNRTEMMSILGETKDDGAVSAAEVTDLRRVLSSLGYMMPDSVQNLTNKVLYGDPANLRSSIGNLFAGSSDAQLDRLIGKWFLGTDRPIAAANTTYRYASGDLFQNGISIGDIHQGAVGDCYFLATLGAYANDQANVIQNMFTDNGDGTFTVRFYNQGITDYVTVDRYLPTRSDGTAVYADWNGGTYTEADNELWVALAEKAYAQLNQSGWIGQDNTNSYEGISGGWMAPVMGQLTGTRAASQSINSMTQVQLINLVSADRPITAGFVSGAGFGVVNEHAYTITAYDATTGQFHLNNPWGNTHADVTWDQLRSLTARIEWS
jgi:Calpain family cysteine protease